MDTVWRSESEVDSRQFDLFDPMVIQHSESLSVQQPVLARDPKPEIIPAAPANEETETVIEDAGAELTYNRRNRVRTAKSWADLAGLNDALKVKEATKANFWPKPDYEQLIADGMKPLVAHIVKQVYDKIPSKPTIGKGMSADEAIQTYIKAINRVEKGVMDWTNDTEALKAWASQNAKIAGAMLGRRISVMDMTGESDTLLTKIYPEGWKPYQDEIRSLGGNSFYKSLNAGYEEINRAMKAIGKGWPEKREAWQVQGMYIVDNPVVSVDKNQFAKSESYLLSVHEKFINSFSSKEAADAAASLVKPFVLFGKRGMLGSFDSEEEATEAAKERTKRDKGKTIDVSGTNVTLAERKGLDRRMEGEDISSEKLMQTFGFKGVNFGNWMKTPSAKVEAQLHLNHAYDAFMDLADVLGVPPKVMSLGGMLGIAIGAQGGGGTASAHFVPGVNEINITRTTGAGWLAHEWGHALDHYWATRAGLSTHDRPYLSEHATLGSTYNRMAHEGGKWVNKTLDRFGDVRPEIVESFKKIVETMNKREETQEEAQADLDENIKRTWKWVDRELAKIRHDITKDEGPHAFDDLAARIRKLDYGDGMVAGSSATYISPVVVEIRDLYKKEHDRGYQIAKVKDLQSSMNHAKYLSSPERAERLHTPQLVSSEYAIRSKILDRNKGGKEYWSTDVEKFARAFDAFVGDALEAKGAHNTYLSTGTWNHDTLPAGAERKAINEAFNALLGEIQLKETERGPVMFSLDDTPMPVTKTQAFKDWLDDSKVVRPDGSPIMMYHGTPMHSNGLGDIEIFDRKATAKFLNRPQTFDMIGSWFSDNPDMDGAAKYAGQNGVIYPVYLSIKKPLVVNSFDELFDMWKDEHSGRLSDKELQKRFKQHNWYGDADNFVDMLKADGFDGIKILAHSTARSSEFTDQSVWIAFDPHQVKAVYGNNRHFSKDNPSILYSLDEGEVLPSLTAEEIAAEINKRQGSWKNMPEVIILDTVAQLPFPARASTNGALQDGRMYLVAEKLYSLHQLQKVVAHECVGHYALEEMLGEKYGQLCDQVQLLKKSGNPEICTIAADIQNRYNKGNTVISTREESAEIIARSVERCLDSNGEIKVEYGWIKGLYADVAQWLREKEINVPFSNFELQGIIANAGAWVKESPLEQSNINQQLQPAFSLNEGKGGKGFTNADDWKLPEMLSNRLPDAVKSLPVKLVGQADNKRYVGAIVAAEAGYVVQHIGKEMAVHPTANLMRVPAIGEKVAIQYNKQNRGEVVEKSRSSNLTR